MRHVRQSVPVLALAVIAACESPTTPRTTVPAVNEEGTILRVATTSTTGSGQFLLQDTIDASFSFSAVRHADGSATGRFHQVFRLNGLTVDFHGGVTCLSIDPVTRRAWIGGVVWHNSSTHPSFTTPINQPGRDVWFRVVDYGGSAGDPADRTTTLGFEGGAGIITSEEYCAVQPWPDHDARTGPVTSGDIAVRE